MYKNDFCKVKSGNYLSKTFKPNKGVRQGCILSPHLFNIYTEQVMREAEIEDMGIRIGGRNITDMR